IWETAPAGSVTNLQFRAIHELRRESVGLATGSEVANGASDACRQLVAARTDAPEQSVPHRRHVATPAASPHGRHSCESTAAGGPPATAFLPTPRTPGAEPGPCPRKAARRQRVQAVAGAGSHV